MRRFAIFGLAVAVAGVAACTHPANGNMCVTGDQKECPCLGGGQGVQLCLADGTYDTCQCPEMGVPSEDMSMPEDLSMPLPDFSGVDLYGVDLTAPLPPPDFAGVDLFGVDLSTPPSPDLSMAPLDLSLPLDMVQLPLDFSGVDLVGVDLMAPPDFGGTSCGAMTCSGTQVCCLSSPSTGSCFPASGCDGGASPFACDGPEDCAGGQCCVEVVTSSGGGENGKSYCSASCPGGSYVLNPGGGATEKSIMCHSDSECSGYSGTIPIGGMVGFNGCCHSNAATGSYHVCIPTSFAGAAGYTCP
jgi:hypothetical protein